MQEALDKSPREIAAENDITDEELFGCMTLVLDVDGVSMEGYIDEEVEKPFEASLAMVAGLIQHISLTTDGRLDAEQIAEEAMVMWRERWQ